MTRPPIVVVRKLLRRYSVPLTQPTHLDATDAQTGMPRGQGQRNLAAEGMSIYHDASRIKIQQAVERVRDNVRLAHNLEP